MNMPVGTGLTMAESWEDFKKTVIPADASPIQVEEMQKAFYAGGHLVISTFVAIGESGVPDEVGLVVVTAMRKDISAFFEKLGDAYRRFMH